MKNVPRRNKMITLEIIRYEICSFLQVEDVSRMARVCKDWCGLMDQEMCDYFLKRDFNFPSPETEGAGDWKLYQTFQFETIEYQDFKGTQVWKPRVGNIVFVSDWYDKFIKVQVKKIKGNQVTVERLSEHPRLERRFLIVFHRGFGRWEYSGKNKVRLHDVSYKTAQLFEKILSLNHSVIKHDYKTY